MPTSKIRNLWNASPRLCLSVAGQACPHLVRTKHQTEVVQDELLLYLQLIRCASSLLFTIILHSQIVLTLDVALDDEHRQHEQNVLPLIEDGNKKKLISS